MKSSLQKYRVYRLNKTSAGTARQAEERQNCSISGELGLMLADMCPAHASHYMWNT